MARNIRYTYSLGGGVTTQPVRLRLPVAASQDIEVGDGLSIDGSGELAIAGAGDSIDAVAYEPSANQAQGTMIEVEIVQPHQVWQMTASADASSNVRDGTDTYDINASQQVNLADTTGGGIRIVGIDADDNTYVDVQITNPFFA